MNLRIIHCEQHGWCVVDDHAPRSRKYLDKHGQFVDNAIRCWHKSERSAKAAVQRALGRHEQFMREREEAKP